MDKSVIELTLKISVYLLCSSPMDKSAYTVLLESDSQSFELSTQLSKSASTLLDIDIFHSLVVRFQQSFI